MLLNSVLQIENAFSTITITYDYWYTQMAYGVYIHIDFVFIGIIIWAHF